MLNPSRPIRPIGLRRLSKWILLGCARVWFFKTVIMCVKMTVLSCNCRIWGIHAGGLVLCGQVFFRGRWARFHCLHSVCWLYVCVFCVTNLTIPYVVDDCLVMRTCLLRSVLCMPCSDKKVFFLFSSVFPITTTFKTVQLIIECCVMNVNCVRNILKCSRSMLL